MNHFTQKSPVTLRGLLSHSAGITVSGFPGYINGTKLPTLHEILNGQSPANNKPIQVDTEPGKIFRVSGGGYCILQELLQEQMITSSYEDVIQELVLGKLNMTSSTFSQPLNQSCCNMAASGHTGQHHPTVVKGEWYVYPEQADAGMWTTPTDYVKFVIAIQNSFVGSPNALLQHPTAMDMLSEQLPGAGNGMGALVLGDTEHGIFVAEGINRGFSSLLYAKKQPGDIIVAMSNYDEVSKEWASRITRALCIYFDLELC